MATTKKSKKTASASPLDLPEPITNEMLNRVEIARVMEKEYGRYRHDLAGLLWSILGELVARRHK